MADCEVKALLQAPLASPQRGQCPRRGKGETKEGTSELDRIRWDRKRGSRASAEQYEDPVSGTAVTHVGAPVAWETRIIHTAVATPLVSK
ncbi:hypothetical protein TNCV_4615431 [Trichonephila clavipes]|nr:hypothetical protein TNCV_4615431 [Trichonephila clavipes]